MHHVLSCLETREYRSVLLQWSWYVRQEKEMERENKIRQERMFSIVQRIQHRCLFRAWSTWEHRHHIRRVAKRLLQRMQRSCLGRCLKQWSHRSWLRIQARNMLASILLRKERAELSHAHQGWVIFTLQERLQSLMSGASSQLERQQEDTKRRLLRRVLRRFLLYRGLRSAFDEWRVWSTRLAQLFETRSFVQRRWLHKRLSSSFDGWRSNVLHTVRRRRKVQRIVRLLRSRELHRAVSENVKM